MAICVIALGSNLQRPLKQLDTAVATLNTLPEVELQALSPWYQSKAIGPGQQPDYINGVARLYSSLEPLDLLSLLQNIEDQQQRKRLQRWGPRTLDLDLLLYNNQVITEARLTVPHPRMLERNFVLYPLFDVAPELQLPDGSLLKHRIQQCPSDGLQLVDATASPTIADRSSFLSTARLAPRSTANNTTTAGDKP
jgi:2-amino-4-hydroxy-6-hydroxymethyldihydropteridine diphosphokinase